MPQQQIAVLVVEDEFLVRFDIVEALEEAGFIVFEAGSSFAAIEVLAGNGQIDVMFTDIDIPGGMDGLDLAALVGDRWPGVEIIVTSGHRRIHEDRLAPGGRFLDKPYSPALVVSTIRTLF